MLKITFISLLLLSNIAFSQVKDDFSDREFLKNPPWNGDTDYFQVNSQQQLQSKGQQIASQIYTLSTVSEISLNGKWEFLVQLNLDPTTTNYVRVYLTSTRADLKASLNGYFIQIGETGTTDGIHLYRQTGTSTTRIITGAQKVRVNANLMLARIQVTRDENGNWTVYSDASGGNNFTIEGTATDRSFDTSGFMGVYCRYATASRYNQFIFDDFVVEDFVPDLSKPVLKKLSVVDERHLDLIFSKPLDSATASTLINYDLSEGYGSPAQITLLEHSNVIRLSYPKSIMTGRYVLSLHQIRDKKGNEIEAASTYSFFHIKPYTSKYGDVVINEIFANPTGSPGIPQKEFVELWNRSSEYLLMKGWNYADAGTSVTFSADTLKPGSYVILCLKADTSLFKPYGHTIGLSPWPILNNDKDVLTVRNPDGLLIDQVAYQDSYYRDDRKKKGGYSLELIDPENLCKGMQNWNASNAVSGATPGTENSIFQSQITTESPKIRSAQMLDSTHVQLVFSKAVDSLSAVQAQHYSVNNGGKVIKAEIEIPAFNKVKLTFEQELQRGIEHRIRVDQLTDCASNLVDGHADEVKVFKAKRISKNDILISEVLFNPRPNGVDFVEVYNNSDHVLDLKDLQLGNADQNGHPANLRIISDSTILIPPHGYWVLTTNKVNIQNNYPSAYDAAFTQMNRLLAYNNDRGCVVIISDGLVIDRFDYSEKMHHPLLRIADGVSLERVSFVKASFEVGNFKSAAASVGFATPGVKNSQEIVGDQNFVHLVSKTFSPDGDGFEDELKLIYQLADNDFLATVHIYNDNGVLIRKLIQNETVATKGEFFWDGLKDNGAKAELGIYVILFDAFRANGKKIRLKNTCVLTRK